MIKRVSIVSALLFTAHIASGQTIVSSQVIQTNLELDKPVVTVSGATGTTIQDDVATSATTSVELSPAEMASTSPATSSTESVGAETGAFGTSSATNVSATTSIVIETEEGTETQLSRQVSTGLFDLVFEGFETFVRITLGWQ